MPDYDSHSLINCSQIVLENPEMIILRSMRKAQPLSFSVNKALLCYYSAYFQALINGPFKEGLEEKTEIKLDVSQKVLRQFYGWLTTGRVQMGFQPDVTIKLWIFGDFIDSLALRRDAITHLQRSSREQPSVGMVGYMTLHENKVWTEFHNSALYVYIVHTFSYHWDHRREFALRGGFAGIGIPEQFLHDQRTSMSMHRERSLAGSISGHCYCCHGTWAACKYHEHTSQEEQSATCGSRGEDLVGKFWDEDASDDDEQTEDAQNKQADGKGGGEKRENENSDGGGDHDSKNHNDSQNDEEMELTGTKRKAQDKSEDGSAKKLKQGSGI
ncbi:hypothetical protein D6C93_05751 [Aureobasidium pullulans]|nr:hypothetical protein D6C93_05751 [Aureobasidium pullulans]